MQAVPAPTPAITPNRVEEAHRLYANFQFLASNGLQTDKLSQQICASVNKESKTVLYKIKACKLSLPYKLTTILDILKMDLPDVVNHVLIKRATYISVIFHQTFRLYLRQKISGCTTIYEVQHGTIVPLQTEQVIPEDDSYIIFISHNLTHTLEKQKDKLFYCYRPPLRQSMNWRVAPFHHEVQRDGLCGLHAVNAFVGCNYLNEEHLSFYKAQWSQYSDVRLNSSQKFDGVDPTLLMHILNKIVSSETEYQIVSIDADMCNDRQSLLLMLQLKLQPIDRYIVGSIVGSTGHCYALRKDRELVWWRVDSERNDQDSFENELELIDELIDDLLDSVETSKLYCQLFLLLPKGDDKEVHFHEKPPLV